MLLQDFTGVPCVVDLAAMRDAIAEMGGEPERINPLQPVEIVIDHSVQVDAFGSADAFEHNAKLEFERNGERYGFLKWGQLALDGYASVPPDTGIVHQVNIEYLARIIFGAGGAGEGHPTDAAPMAYPDSTVGTDSHTTMVNGVGVLAWGVGGIEAEAAMLGQPVTMLIPEVIGFRLNGELREGVTATDLVLQITADAAQERRGREVRRVLTVEGSRATCRSPTARRSATCRRNTARRSRSSRSTTQTLTYLRLTGRTTNRSRWSKRTPRRKVSSVPMHRPNREFTDTLELDLVDRRTQSCRAERPQDRVPLHDVQAVVRERTR